MNKIILVALLLTGCAASEPPTPEAQLTPEQIIKRDKARADIATCKYEAAKATGSSPSGYSLYAAMFSDVTNTFREVELYNMCLESKGWGQKKT
jgi:hypothetical protein